MKQYRSVWTIFIIGISCTYILGQNHVNRRYGLNGDQLDMSSCASLIKGDRIFIAEKRYKTSVPWTLTPQFRLLTLNAYGDLIDSNVFSSYSKSLGISVLRPKDNNSFYAAGFSNGSANGGQFGYLANIGYDGAVISDSLYEFRRDYSVFRFTIRWCQ